jgi:hypothetical protein
MSYQIAAARCWTDGETLFAAGRLGTPDHLYGLAAECALKAILHGIGVIPPAAERPPHPYKEHIDKLWDEYESTVAGRALASLQVSQPSPFLGWRVSDRYAGDATFSPVRVAGHRAGARSAMQLLEQAQIAGVVS